MLYGEFFGRPPLYLPNSSMFSFFLISRLLKFMHQVLPVFSSLRKKAFRCWLDFFSIIQVCYGSGSQQWIISISGLVVTQDNKGFTQGFEVLLLDGWINWLKESVVSFTDLLWCGAWFDVQNFVVIYFMKGGGGEVLTEGEWLTAEGKEAWNHCDSLDVNFI